MIEPRKKLGLDVVSTKASAHPRGAGGDPSVWPQVVPNCGSLFSFVDQLDRGWAWGGGYFGQSSSS